MKRGLKEIIAWWDTTRIVRRSRDFPDEEGTERIREAWCLCPGWGSRDFPDEEGTERKDGWQTKTEASQFQRLPR